MFIIDFFRLTKNRLLFSILCIVLLFFLRIFQNTVFISMPCDAGFPSVTCNGDFSLIPILYRASIFLSGPKILSPFLYYSLDANLARITSLFLFIVWAYFLGCCLDWCHKRILIKERK
jgi:hypothetical protein